MKSEAIIAMLVERFPQLEKDDPTLLLCLEEALDAKTYEDFIDWMVKVGDMALLAQE